MRTIRDLPCSNAMKGGEHEASGGEQGRPSPTPSPVHGASTLLGRFLIMVLDPSGTYIIAIVGTIAEVSVCNIAFRIVAIPLDPVKAVSVATVAAEHSRLAPIVLKLMGH